MHRGPRRVVEDADEDSRSETTTAALTLPLATTTPEQLVSNTHVDDLANIDDDDADDAVIGDGDDKLSLTTKSHAKKPEIADGAQLVQVSSLHKCERIVREIIYNVFFDINYK